ncbi:hypothetical protein [Algoriella xinjiangensis]|uniref:hypothetical protein n=1 Tax=Algoriella xinjiangensis TaxID=684065 RepID=UPI003B849B6E
MELRFKIKHSYNTVINIKGKPCVGIAFQNQAQLQPIEEYREIEKSWICASKSSKVTTSLHEALLKEQLVLRCKIKRTYKNKTIN